MSRIFISYKRVDKEKVFKIKDQIESALVEKCWIDLDGIESDAQFANVIIKAINECEVFLFMYSAAHSKITDYKNDWTVRELDFAQHKKKRIVFVNLDASPLSDWFYMLFGTMQQVDATSSNSILRLISDIDRTPSVELGQNNKKVDLEKMANDVRVQSEQFQGSMSELVYNPTSGEFETRQIGSDSSMPVTELASEGFAGPPDSSQPKNCSHEPTIWNYDKHLNTDKPSFWFHLFGKKNKPHTVYSSVFAPAEIAPKQHLMVQVYLHLPEETEAVKSLASEADKNAERRGYEPLEVPLKKGDNVEIELNVNGDSLLYNCRKSVVWQGSFVKRAFDFIVPSDINTTELSCSVNIFVNGAIAGELIFLTAIVDSPRQLNTNVCARPTKKLFISYSHKDIASAEKIAKIHEALGIDVFFDKHRLKAGYIYSEEISKFIQAADTFVLCWSENAAKSDYVEKERQEALSLAYPQRKPMEQAQLRIHSYNIEPHAVPPADMIEHYHFEEL